MIRLPPSPRLGRVAYLSREEARRFYDRIGRRLDTQGFYENPALDRLVRSGSPASARSIVEVGCGTGRLARRLLADEAASDALYAGFEISPVMASHSRDRLARFRERAALFLIDGSPPLPLEDSCCDRFLATYLFDLLPPEEIESNLSDAARLLRPEGLLCTAGLTFGRSAPARIVIALWKQLHRISPRLVGGCRPLRLQEFLDPEVWELRSREVVEPWGVPSEVLVASRRPARSRKDIPFRRSHSA